MSITIFLKNRHKKHLSKKLCNLKAESSYYLRQCNNSSKAIEITKDKMNYYLQLATEVDCGIDNYLDQADDYSSLLYQYEKDLANYNYKYSAIESRLANLQKKFEKL